MTNLEMVKEMLEIERAVRVREDKEVTVDFASTRSELRSGLLEELIRNWRTDG